MTLSTSAKKRATVSSALSSASCPSSTMEREDPLKPLHDYRIWLGKVDFAIAMARLIAAWRTRRRRERQVDCAWRGS